MTIDTELAKSISRLLRTAEASGAAIEPITGPIPAGNIDSAYLVQSVSVREWVSDDRRIVGR